MANIKKTYYSISEVCAKTELEAHVLRYWESEFPQLRPKKNRAGNRAYREKDIEIVQYIKYLLYDELYTIPGAKKKCAQIKDTDIPSCANGHSDSEKLDQEPITESGKGQLQVELLQELKELLVYLKS